MQLLAHSSHQTEPRTNQRKPYHEEAGERRSFPANRTSHFRRLEHHHHQKVHTLPVPTDSYQGRCPTANDPAANFPTPAMEIQTAAHPNHLSAPQASTSTRNPTLPRSPLHLPPRPDPAQNPWIHPSSQPTKMPLHHPPPPVGSRPNSEENPQKDLAIPHPYESKNRQGKIPPGRGTDGSPFPSLPPWLQASNQDWFPENCQSSAGSKTVPASVH